MTTQFVVIMKRELKQFGLGDSEITVYLACLAGRLTPSQIAEKTGMKRTSVYTHLDALKSKGLIATRVYRRNRLITPTPPDKIFPLLVEREQQKIDDKKQLLNDLVAAVEKKIQTTKIPDTNVTIYETREDFYALVEQVISLKSNIYWIGNMNIILKYVGEEEFFKRMTVPRMDTDTSAYAISSSDLLDNVRFGKIYSPFRFVRVLEEVKDIPGMMASYDDHFCLITQKQDRMYCVDIHDPIIASIYTIMFKALWSRLDKK